MPGVAVLGPTASGKSDVAMAMATRSVGGPYEIVAVDAMQVYRGMDIGTAKPSAEDRVAVPHHGLDLADPDEEFTVTEYVGSVAPAIEEMPSRGVTPLLVGGTGLYLRAVTDPMEIPGTWPDVRTVLEARLVAEPVEALHAELVSLDPLAASRMEPTNVRRVVRALEVCLGSGRPFSSFGPGMQSYPPIGVVQIGLRWQRPVLARRIEARVHRMIGAGLVDEVRELRDGVPVLSRTARQALGYKEVLDHLDGRCSLDEAVATVILRTRQFAVRQERWFRRDPRVRWVDIHDDPVAEALPAIARILGA